MCFLEHSLLFLPYNREGFLEV